jgi:hypothetical protein
MGRLVWGVHDDAFDHALAGRGSSCLRRSRWRYIAAPPMAPSVTPPQLGLDPRAWTTRMDDSHGPLASVMEMLPGQ